MYMGNSCCNQDIGHRHDSAGYSGQDNVRDFYAMHGMPGYGGLGSFPQQMIKGLSLGNALPESIADLVKYESMKRTPPDNTGCYSLPVPKFYNSRESHGDFGGNTYDRLMMGYGMTSSMQYGMKGQQPKINLSKFM